MEGIGSIWRKSRIVGQFEVVELCYQSSAGRIGFSVDAAAEAFLAGVLRKSWLYLPLENCFVSFDESDPVLFLKKGMIGGRTWLPPVSIVSSSRPTDATKAKASRLVETLSSTGHPRGRDDWFDRNLLESQTEAIFAWDTDENCVVLSRPGALGQLLDPLLSETSLAIADLPADQPFPEW